MFKSQTTFILCSQFDKKITRYFDLIFLSYRD